MMTLKSLVTLDGYEVKNRAESIYFYAPGKARLGEVVTPTDIYEHSEKYKDGRWSVLVEPMIVGLCPSDMAGGLREFPPGSRRILNDVGSPAVAGHEFVGRVVGASERSVGELANKGIQLGDLVAGDINNGCDYCFQCARGDPPLYCNNGTTFIGIGSSLQADWVGEETSRPHLPGAYTAGFMVFPTSQIHLVPRRAYTLPELAAYSQTDAIACSKNACDKAGITTWEMMRGINNPNVLVIGGGGRVGSWIVAVVQDLLPGSNIAIADINHDNLMKTGDFYNISFANRYHVQRGSRNKPYSRESIDNAFGRGVGFDVVFDAAGHGVLSGGEITQILEEVVLKGGAFCTTSHVGVMGIEAGHPSLVIGQKRFVNAISPAWEFPYSLNYIANRLESIASSMTEIPGGLTDELAEIVATGGGEYKSRMEGTAFYTRIGNHG